MSAAIRAAFSTRRRDEWEQQVERDAKDGTQVLLLRGSRLPPGADTGYVVVFDDITHLMQAQRDAAWGEVARRLAHEIKNPLTPIQLSAERLREQACTASLPRTMPKCSRARRARSSTRSPR